MKLNDIKSGTTQPNRAKRLECGVFRRFGFWVGCRRLHSFFDSRRREEMKAPEYSALQTLRGIGASL